MRQAKKILIKITMIKYKRATEYKGRENMAVFELVLEGGA